MKKKIIGITVCIVVILCAGIIIWDKNQLTENEVMEVLNEVTSQYGDMNTSNDQTFSLRVDDMLILLITYAPSYSLLGVDTEAYTAKPDKPDEVFRSEEELWSPICNYDNALIYNEKADKYYNVSFKSTKNPTIPMWETAKELK